MKNFNLSIITNPLKDKWNNFSSLWRTNRGSCYRAKSLDVSETLKSHGGFFHPITNQIDKKMDSRIVVYTEGFSGNYEVSLRDDIKANKDTLINIYGATHKKDIKSLIFHQHYFCSYQKKANSPTIQGYLHTVNSSENSETVIVHGHIKFFYINKKTDKENSLYAYFGKNSKDGNNGGIVFDKNNLAISGELQICSQNSDEKYRKTYNIETLSEAERMEFKKLNLFDIAI